MDAVWLFCSCSTSHSHTQRARCDTGAGHCLEQEPTLCPAGHVPGPALPWPVKQHQLNHFLEHAVDQLREQLWVKTSQQNTVHGDLCLPTCKSRGGCIRKGMWRNLGRHKASKSTPTLWLQCASLGMRLWLFLFSTEGGQGCELAAQSSSACLMLASCTSTPTHHCPADFPLCPALGAPPEPVRATKAAAGLGSL